ERDGRIVDDRRRRASVLDRGGVDERFERRSRLTERLRHSIELRVIELTTSDERAHRAIARIHREERTLKVRGVPTRRLVAVRYPGCELLVRAVRECAVLPSLDRT